jgi:hypothetical protein
MSSGGPNDKITKNGQILTRRVWALIADVGRENGRTLRVVQGGFKHGHGASASGSTHDQGDVYDISIGGMTRSQALAVVNDFREWYGDAWLRTPEFGWPSSAGGPHIHVVQADSHYALSRGAQQQVTAYNNGRNGLSNNGRDPHPQPPRKHYTMSGTAPDVVIGEDEDMAFIFKTHKDGAPSGQTGGGAAYVVLGDGHAFQLGGSYKATGLPVVESPDQATDDRFYATTIRNQR